MLSKLFGWFMKEDRPTQAVPIAPREDAPTRVRRVADPAYDDAKEKYGAAERYFWHTQERELDERAERVRQRLEVIRQR